MINPSFSKTIIEFATLLLPYKYVASESRITYFVQSFASCISHSLCVNTKSYLAGLKELTKLSGRNYAEVLKDMMSQISESITDHFTTLTHEK